MPKFPPIPRLSILVPIGRDLAAFESTLISVLENQASDCEVLVCHDGQYDDPFELCDEVRFVVAESSNLISLVSAGASQARGRFVHIIADGVQATRGWTDEALEKFEHFDCGSISPVIRNADGEIVSAGWIDGADRLCKNASQGRRDVDPKASKQIGAHLQASFWRRELLRSLSEAFTSRQSVESTYAYEHLSRQAGWRCVLADQSEVQISGGALPWDQTSTGRGKRTQAIRNEFSRSGGWAGSLTAAGWAMLASVLRPSGIAEAIGRGFAPLAAKQISRNLHRDQVALCDDREMIVSMPRRDVSVQKQTRRAA
ncbi:MAG: glycosyltransferase family 2 protein [Rubripirellula sp.]